MKYPYTARSDKFSRTHGDTLVGHQLRRVRVARGHTQEELAHALTESTPSSWTQSRVGNYETGRIPLSLARFIQVCACLQVHPARVLQAAANTDAWLTSSEYVPPAGDSAGRVNSRTPSPLQTHAQWLRSVYGPAPAAPFVSDFSHADSADTEAAAEAGDTHAPGVEEG